ncbi:unnamed protein product [Trichobilharzia regenti]|nr:unnamed protein product [Trichobilharzia regenti]
MCSLAKCIQCCTCRNCHSKYSIILIAIFSILFNLPLFFVQKVNSGIVPSKNSTEQMNNAETSEWMHTSSKHMINSGIVPSKNSTEQMNNAETSEWMHTSSKHMSNSTASDYQINQSQTQVYIGLTEFGSSEFYKIFSWTRIMLVQVLPLLFLCLVNFCLFRFIHIANRRRQKYLLPKGLNKKSRRFELNKINLHCPKANGGSSARWQAAQRKLTILLIVIVGLFIAGQIPQGFAYITIFEAFTSHFGSVCKRWRCCQPYLIYRSISHMLGLFTYAINFFVYLTLNKHFKQQLKIWFLSIFPSKNQLQKPYASKQNKPSYYSYNQSKSDGSFASQHKCNNNTRPYYNNNINNNRHYNIWKKFNNLRRRSSILYYDNKNKVNSIQTPESLLSSNQPIITLADDTLKHLIINNPCYTNQPQHLQQSTISTGNDINYHSFVSLQPTTNCHTEIKYGTNQPLLLYKTFRVGLSFSYIYCPLVYRESDFDVISVDESVEQHEPEHNSFL